MIEAVKLADDWSGDVVVRLYESLGGRAGAILRPGFPAIRAEIVDLLERPAEDISAELRERSLGDTHGALDIAEDGSIGLSLRPFQILTVRLSVSA